MRIHLRDGLLREKLAYLLHLEAARTIQGGKNTYSRSRADVKDKRGIASNWAEYLLESYGPTVIHNLLAHSQAL
jgi:hypothetical protein